MNFAKFKAVILVKIIGAKQNGNLTCNLSWWTYKPKIMSISASLENWRWTDRSKTLHSSQLRCVGHNKQTQQNSSHVTLQSFVKMDTQRTCWKTLEIVGSYLNFNKENRFHQSWFGCQLAGIQYSSCCWDDLSTTSVDGISVKGYIMNVVTYTTYIFLAKYTLKFRVKNFNIVLNSLIQYWNADVMMKFICFKQELNNRNIV